MSGDERLPGAAFRCLRCHKIFRSLNFRPFGSNIIISGCKVNCFYCHGEAVSIDGTFSISPERIDVISGQDVTRDIIYRLNQANDRFRKAAEAGSAKLDELIADVDSFSPALAAALRPVVKTKPIAVVMFILTWVIALLSSNSLNGQINWNELVSQLMIYHQDRPEDLAVDLTKLRVASSSKKEALDEEVGSDRRGDEDEKLKKKKSPNQRIRQNQAADLARRWYRAGTHRGKTPS